MSELMALSSVDGRYANRVQELAPMVSEYGLIRYRVAVEAAWLKTLGSGILPDLEPMQADQLENLDMISSQFSESDAERVKEIEKTTNHDVKSVELWLKEKLVEQGGFDDYLEFIHFGCTSEDINNLAYAMMLRDSRDQVILPAIDSIGMDLETKAHDYADIAVLAKTHGQPATPTTLGKEMAVFVKRLSDSARTLGSLSILGKFSGATGNYSADLAAYPDVDWEDVSIKFVESLGFEHNGLTTQIEPHDYMARYFNELALTNTIMIDLARDMWLYISAGVFKQKVVKEEVGSSTMPHKVNPIDFENAEANLGLANATLNHLSAKLPISRLQRDLSDSSAQRSIGTGLGFSLVAFSSMKKGLGKVVPDEEAIARELDSQWAILAEPLQTVMRRFKIPDAYNKIKAVSRGQAFTEDTYRELVGSLEIPEEAKERLLKLSPKAYVGIAPDLARSAKYNRGR